MPNMYEMLIGAGPTGPEQTKQAAQMLRRNQGMNELAMLSGDRLLNPMGQQQAQQQQQNVGQLQQQRQAGLALSRQQAADEERARANMADEAQRKLDAELSREQAQQRFEMQEARFQQAERRMAFTEQKALNRDRQKLEGELTKAGLPDMDARIEQLDAQIGKYYDKETGEVIGDIPGIGAGRYNPLPGAEARDVLATKAAVLNVLLKARSGAAVTETEYERFKQEFGDSAWNTTDQTFINAWERLKGQVESQREGINKGYTDDVLGAYYGEDYLAKGAEGAEVGIKIGFTRDGYEYTGGDPSDEGNWKMVE